MNADSDRTNLNRDYAVPLADEFERYRSSQFLFVNPGGNWGDHLIWRGVECLADRYDIGRSSVSFDKFINGDYETSPSAVVYIQGGGGYNQWATGRVRQCFLHALRHHSGPIIQGPQTCQDDSNYLVNSLSTNEFVPSNRVVFFCREETSLRACQRFAAQNPWFELKLDHDTAVHSDVSELRRIAGKARAKYDLLAVREDNERPVASLASRYDAIMLDPARYASSFDHWVRIHARAKSIVTNRTHSAVLGSLLGVPTTVLAGSYHKNRSVWSYTLEKRGVCWAEPKDIPLRHRRFVGPLATALRVFGRSWKARRAIMSLAGVPKC